MMRRAPTSTLFPYTTLFRSCPARAPLGSALLAIELAHRARPHRGLQPGQPSLERLGVVVACQDRKSTRLNSSHTASSYAVVCSKKQNAHRPRARPDREIAGFGEVPVGPGALADRLVVFFLHDAASTDIYPLSLHDALPILPRSRAARLGAVGDRACPPRAAPSRPAAGPTFARAPWRRRRLPRSEEHTSELQSHSELVCRRLLEKTKCPPSARAP